MADICLPQAEVSKFREAIVSGKINPEELSLLSSVERHAALSQVVGEANAQTVNSLFESRLLLKNQKTAYVAWAKNVMGVTPEVRRDLISRIERMEKVLDPEEADKFLGDLAATKLGFDVTQVEAKKIADMSKAISDAKALQREDGTFATEQQRLDYGYAKHDLGAYVSDLKNGAPPTIKGAITNPVGTAKTIGSKTAEMLKHPGKTATAAAGLSKSLKRSE